MVHCRRTGSDPSLTWSADIPAGSLSVAAAGRDAGRLRVDQHRMCSFRYSLVTTLILNLCDEAVT